MVTVWRFYLHVPYIPDFNPVFWGVTPTHLTACTYLGLSLDFVHRGELYRAVFQTFV